MGKIALILPIVFLSCQSHEPAERPDMTYCVVNSQDNQMVCADKTHGVLDALSITEANGYMCLDAKSQKSLFDYIEKLELQCMGGFPDNRHP
jgi:hypothetical protein